MTERPDTSREYSSIEAAKFFNKNPRTVIRWIENGYLEGRKDGLAQNSHWRISGQSIEDALKQMGLLKTD